MERIKTDSKSCSDRKPTSLPTTIQVVIKQVLFSLSRLQKFQALGPIPNRVFPKTDRSPNPAGEYQTRLGNKVQPNSRISLSRARRGTYTPPTPILTEGARHPIPSIHPSVFPLPPVFFCNSKPKASTTNPQLSRGSSTSILQPTHPSHLKKKKKKKKAYYSISDSPIKSSSHQMRSLRH